MKRFRREDTRKHTENTVLLEIKKSRIEELSVGSLPLPPVPSILLQSALDVVAQGHFLPALPSSSPSYRLHIFRSPPILSHPTTPPKPSVLGFSKQISMILCRSEMMGIVIYRQVAWHTERYNASSVCLCRPWSLI